MRLVIDRETERAWMVPSDEANEVLRLQWPVLELPADGAPFFSFEELMEAIERMAAELPPALTVEQLVVSLADSAAQYAALERALAARKQSAGRCVVCDGAGWMHYPHPGENGAASETAAGPCAGCVQDGLCSSCGHKLADCGPVRICASCGFVFDEAARRQAERL